MKPLNLPKENRSTEKISPELLQRVREQIEGLAHGSVEIMVKSGYVIGFKFHQWRPFRSKSEGLKQEK
ncbi:hypothetical protein ES703_40717 [subsurface metagenome]